MKIRNIWGKIDWDGEWSNSYKFWDDDLKKKLHYDPDDEQVFYLEYNGCNSPPPWKKWPYSL